jgi:hypothetical protein
MFVNETKSWRDINKHKQGAAHVQACPEWNRYFRGIRVLRHSCLFVVSGDVFSTLLLAIMLVAWVYLPVCFDFLQTGDERWLYGCGDWLLSQSFKWKNVLLKGSPQWRSTLEEQLQHLSPVPVNIITYRYKIWGFHDGEYLDCGILTYGTV